MFTQPDSIIPDPGNSMDWNRYAYVNYNPINFNDPTGHYSDSDDDFVQAMLRGDSSFWSWGYYKYKEYSYGNQQVNSKYYPRDEYKTQYSQQIRDEFGWNSCGYFASTGGDYNSMVEIKNGYPYPPGTSYTSEYGVQPSELYDEVSYYFAQQGGHVTQSQYNGITGLAIALENGARVVVDIRVGQGTEVNLDDDFAHFAEVLAIDYNNEQVLLADSVSYSPGDVSISFDDFRTIWWNPEQSSVYGRNHQGEYKQERVIFWAMFIYGD